MRLTIIGAGPGGYVAAVRAAQKGASVTVIESAGVGGTCLHWGCIPTKTLIASTEALLRVRSAREFGVDVAGTVTSNLDRIRQRTEKVVATQEKGIRSLLKGWDVRVISGRGFFIEPRVVRAVQPDGVTQDLFSDAAIIATGSRPAGLPDLPFDGESVLSSDDAVRMRRVPGSIIIVGAGVIGCEFAFIYHVLGASVTLVEAMPRALSSEDAEISAIIEREFKKAKIGLVTGARIAAVRRTGTVGLALRLEDGREVVAEQVLVAAGRSMNNSGLGLEAAGVQVGGRGEIVVNDRMETNVPGISAVGDVTGRLMLAHAASRQGIVAAENIMGGSERMEYAAVPSGIFTVPEIGSVGLREHQALEQGIRTRIGRFPYRALGKAHVMGDYTGMVKIIADAATDRVLGVHICGAHATDLVHEGALAVRLGVTSRQLADLVHAHPTFAEVIGEAAEDVSGTAIHAPRRET